MILLERERDTFNGPFFPGLPGWVSTRKVKPIWILLEQETVSGSGISWAICKSAPRTDVFSGCSSVYDTTSIIITYYAEGSTT